MTQRLRQLLVAVAATAAVLTTTVAVSAPAHADPTGSTCMDPTIKGTITKSTATGAFGLQVAVVRFSAVGYTSANCPTTFTDYRYKAAFTYDGRTTSAYQSSMQPVYGPSPTGLGLVRTGTKIVFPDQTLSYAGHGTVNLAMTAGSKSFLSSVWCRSNEETWDYEYYVLPSQPVSFDTVESDGTPRGKVNSCP